MGFIQAFEMLAGTALRLEVTIETQAVTGSLPSGPCIGQSVLSNADRHHRSVSRLDAVCIQANDAALARTRRRPTPAPLV